MRLGDITSVLGAPLPDSSSELAGREPLGYSIDSRTLRPGDLFFAIRGEKHDGHDYVAEVLAKGAIGAVVQREFLAAQGADGSAPGSLMAVDDTLEALQILASSVLSGWRGKTIGITGSMGKTTTKEMTAAVLAPAGRVMKTTGNLNNAFGLPLSILRMESDSLHAVDFDFAVLEMGMNHAGELKALTRIAPPDFGVVTSVAPVHIEFFESLEAIAEAKAELIDGIKPGGRAALNADDPLVARMQVRRTDVAFTTFAIDSPADVQAQNVTMLGLTGTRFMLTTPRGRVDVTLPQAGRHNVYNALAAATVADSYEVSLVSIAAALGDIKSPRMRGEVIEFEEGVTLVDDSYNSNPKALVEMAATIAANRSYARRIIVAGEMLELGQTGPELHREAGRAIAGLGVDLLIGVRGLAREMVQAAVAAGMKMESAMYCDSAAEAADVVLREARPGDLILVKGSRGVRTEAVVERLKGSLHVRQPNAGTSTANGGPGAMSS